MRNPVLVLKSLEEKSCDGEYKYERLYRNLYNPEFYLLAYKNVAVSQGSMTAGADGKTLDEMSMARIENIIASLKDHSYQPTPARREYIAKKNSKKKRPLGIPSTDDKLVQEVVRMILEAIYESTFSNQSHGFRPNRSCHTALLQVQATFTGVKWFVEGDIKACFDSFDHHVLINILRKRIDDEYFIALMWKFLRAGYMEQWVYNTTYSGTPQGSGISPILANIYLTELDRFMEKCKEKFEVGENNHRKVNREYRAVDTQYNAKKKQLKEVWDTLDKPARKEKLQELAVLRAKRASMPFRPVKETGYKRLQYNRYADDFVIGVIGSKDDAEQIKADVKRFLQERLNLTMSEEKTKITHSAELVRYLGYDITVSRDQNWRYDTRGAAVRVWNGVVKLYVPKEKWISKLQEYKAFKIEKDETGKEIWNPSHRGKLKNLQDIDIVSKYNSEIRGIYNYYRLAENATVISKFAYVMEYSMYKTFASKYESSVRKIINKYSRNGVFGVDYTNKSGKQRRELYHDGFSKCRDTKSPCVDTLPHYIKYSGLNSLANRLKRGVCEYCGTPTDKILMHHVKRLADLTGNTAWEQLMMTKRRKSLALCPVCNDKLHDGIL